MIRVVLADDHPVVRSGCLRMLEQCDDIRVIAEADDADAAYAACVTHRPDVLVTDLAMPGGGGLSLIRRVRLRRRHAAVLVVSMYDSALLVQRALAAGASGFLTKASPPECMVDAVRALHAGLRYLGPDLPVALLEPDADTARAAETQRLAALNAHEFETFRHLAEGLSVDDCARELKLSVKTIANHQAAVREKLGAHSLAAWVHLALRHRLIGG